jgi:hypothetical protein
LKNFLDVSFRRMTTKGFKQSPRHFQEMARVLSGACFDAGIHCNEPQERQNQNVKEFGDEKKDCFEH